jgi:UDP-N-acetylmuramoyl-L-alanyl-D-glutamate--2,6-diaminopimelate ligase
MLLGPRVFSAEDWHSVLGVMPPRPWVKEFHGLHPDSRRIRPGFIFVAVPGHLSDGHQYVDDAVKRGAVGVICERPVHCTVPSVQVQNSRVVLSRLARKFYGDPDRELRITAITGTNGKTTVAGFVHQFLGLLNEKAGLLGTVSYSFGERTIPARRTTPGAPELQEFLRSMRLAGCTDCVMEVSSHALDQERVLDLEVSTAVFTNLSQDHLDYHRDMETYFTAKARLFAFASVQHRVVGEDAWSERLAAAYPGQVIRCGLSASCEVRAEKIEADLKGTTAEVLSPWGRGQITLSIPGEHNLRNLLQALAVLGGYGVAMDELCRLTEQLRAAPGRLERVPSTFGRVFVDYAHTPDALAKMVGLLRPLTSGALIVVFGCGGDRDRSKRKLMVEAVAKGADQLILTQDNPRKEDPEQIFNDMRQGLTGKERVEVIPDRAEAIAWAIDRLGHDDVLLIAGKGHETVQEIGSQQVPFDDRAVAVRALRQRELYESGVC